MPPDTSMTTENQAGGRVTAPLPSMSGGAAQSRGDTVFRLLTGGCATLVLLVILAIFVELAWNSRLSIQTFGWRFLVNEWNPVREVFGAASSIYGTLVSTAIAMALAVPIGLVTALFLVELAPPRISKIVGTGVELLAAIPSIIYGMWGLFVFAPFMARYIDPALRNTLGRFLPLFQGRINGQGMLTAGIILAIMILPFITAVTRDVFGMVPAALKESAYGMGATTWEVTRKVTVRYGFRGIIGAALLGLGRAIGETMAVTFVIGNKHEISASLFAPGTSITSALANEFAEASEPLYLSALIELGLILFLITFVIQAIAQVWLHRVSRTMGGGL
jgi:phosphate transport system permease protein